MRYLENPDRQTAPKVCILHIGLEKTATKSIQSWLYSNQERLYAQGLGLTQSFSKPNNWDFVNFFQFALDDWATHKGIQSEAQKRAYFVDFDKKFDEEVGRLASKHVLLTSEHFSSRLRSAEELVKLRDFLASRFDQILVIAWFRPQWEVAVSSWSTSLKSGHFSSLEDWLNKVVEDNYFFNYERIARNWADVFGKENCIFKIFGSSISSPGDAIPDFLDTLEQCGCNLNPRDLAFIGKRQNAALGLFESVVVRAINEKVPYWIQSEGVKRRSELNAELRKLLPELKIRLPLVLSVANRVKIYEEFQASNERFFSTFLQGQGFEQVGLQEDTPIIQVEELAHDLFNLASYLLEFTSPGNRHSLKDADADLLRDSALRLMETGENEKALGLLKMAQRVRPNGPVINKRIREIEDLIKESNLT
jgi:hypothetical protein